MNRLIKKIFVILALSSAFSCGFKVSDTSQNNDFKIREIQTNGNKRVNFKIKNYLLVNSSNKSTNSVSIKLDTEKVKNIKEKNIKNEITKYQIKFNTKVELLELQNFETLKFNISVTNEYLVGQNYSITLTNESKITDYLVDDLSDKILKRINEEINDN